MRRMFAHGEQDDDVTRLTLILQAVWPDITTEMMTLPPSC